MEDNSNNSINKILNIVNKLYKDIGIDVDNSYDEKIRMMHNLPYNNYSDRYHKMGKPNKNKIKHNKIKKYH